MFLGPLTLVSSESAFYLSKQSPKVSPEGPEKTTPSSKTIYAGEKHKKNNLLKTKAKFSKTKLNKTSSSRKQTLKQSKARKKIVFWKNRSLQQNPQM